MKFNVLSLFPQMFLPFSELGVIGQAVKTNKIQIGLINPRDFTRDKHKTVDDRPFGGGDGMIMLYEPLKLALESLSERGQVIYMSPQGQKLNQKMAIELSKSTGPITIICGRYGGLDERLISAFVDQEISVGDYVVSGGELPAMVLIDAIGRQIPGVLGHEKSAEIESFTDGRLESPLFTRPREVDGLTVPQTFCEGDHKKIAELRLQLSLVRTYMRRKDLWQADWDQDLKSAKAALLQMTDSELQACTLDRKSLEAL